MTRMDTQQSTEPSAVAPGQRQLSRPLVSVTRRYRARFCALLRIHPTLTPQQRT